MDMMSTQPLHLQGASTRCGFAVNSLQRDLKRI
jgi:hypothetical protein